MGLDIYSSDDEKNFHIGYIGFSNMRSFFILHYSRESYEDYMLILRATIRWDDNADKLFDGICANVGDLSILLAHSDCDGELTSDECKQLLPCLFVDEDKIRAESSVENNEYFERMIKLMHEFIDLIKYCADHDDVKLIFG